MRDKVFLASFAMVAISCVIFPNSLKLLSTASLFACFATGVADDKLFVKPDGVILAWIASALVSVSYIALGQLSGAPIEAAIQVSVIYIIFPLLWIIALRQLLSTMSLETIRVGLIIIGVIASLTVPVFYFLFFNYGPESVLFFIDEPNIDTATEGYIGSTMHVFGTLIFIFGGYIASFEFSRSSKIEYIILAFFILISLIAGRSALVLTIFIGLILKSISTLANLRNLKLTTVFVSAQWALAIMGILLLTLNSFELDISVLVDPLLDKLSSAGGEGRIMQVSPLIQGIISNIGLGAGHGMGVHYKASETYPWRYEMVWLASVYRVGFVGALIYAAPFFMALAIGGVKLIKGSLSKAEIFLFGGFVSAFIASNTNPYIEAFVFQWMYALPLIYFLGSRRFYRRTLESTCTRGNSQTAHA